MGRSGPRSRGSVARSHEPFRPPCPPRRRRMTTDDDGRRRTRDGDPPGVERVSDGGGRRRETSCARRSRRRPRPRRPRCRRRTERCLVVHGFAKRREERVVVEHAGVESGGPQRVEDRVAWGAPTDAGPPESVSTIRRRAIRRRRGRSRSPGGSVRRRSLRARSPCRSGYRWRTPRSSVRRRCALSHHHLRHGRLRHGTRRTSSPTTSSATAPASPFSPTSVVAKNDPASRSDSVVVSGPSAASFCGSSSASRSTRIDIDWDRRNTDIGADDGGLVPLLDVRTVGVGVGVGTRTRPRNERSLLAPPAARRSTSRATPPANPWCGCAPRRGPVRAPRRRGRGSRSRNA